ncbi:hypothetical protein [Rubritalea squalenifaciens]|nr:hypothetical protein [Rubritalea squalenifaciens]
MSVRSLFLLCVLLTACVHTPPDEGEIWTTNVEYKELIWNRSLEVNEGDYIKVEHVNYPKSYRVESITKEGVKLRDLYAGRMMMVRENQGPGYNAHSIDLSGKPTARILYFVMFSE